MCGIAGIFNYADPNRPVDPALLTRMTRSLAHRGPDAEDFWIEEGRANIGFGHRRLSIVDLTPTGAQPMPNDDRSCWITYNGEFYNHHDFRARLKAQGVRFRGASDTETMLRLIEADGPDALKDAAGIFGLGFWDGRRRTLTLARDPLGVKQVYFHDNGERIIFASEIKALLQDPEVPRDVDPEAINQYLHFHTALFERTFFRQIRQLRAGEYLQISRHGARLHSYWSLDDFHKESGSEREQIDDLRHLLTEIVGDQLMSDVPVGAFFSGGIDSTAIAAHASRAGKPPICFGVHFSGESVTDERPYQEAAAKALGLDLHLITMDGSTFPEDLTRLMHQQDEPVIGAAMFPMARVSELASRYVKVCLGGQAADEIFGGYARYALGRPLQVARSWFSGRFRSRSQESGESRVRGNLARQISEGGTFYRLMKNARYLAHWENSYFENFAQVPEHDWHAIFNTELCSRDRCWRTFRDHIARSPASDPTDKLMLWDMKTYLTGLFHQDDRMSMASSLESRVPFADPRVVRAAFRVDPDLKLRSAASKWILREAVSDVLPAFVLNRRKVGFDTPADRWIRSDHAGFVRETLLSSRARQRGLLQTGGIESLLSNPSGGNWFNQVWKALCIEVWASLFLDSTPVTLHPENRMEVSTTLSPTTQPKRELRESAVNLLRECQDLGVRRTLARGLWEMKTRTGLVRVKPSLTAPERIFRGQSRIALEKLPFTDPSSIAAILPLILSEPDRNNLMHLASEASRGRIVCFSRWMADFGNPIDWHRDPTSDYRWPANVHWSKVRQIARSPGEIKFCWEVGRFPQAYTLARAAVLDPEAAPVLAAAFYSQMDSFIAQNPRPQGIHWGSGQEVAFRMMAWMFAIHVFSALGFSPAPSLDAAGLQLRISADHIASHIEYARDSVYNNHLLSEALGLFLAGSVLSGESAVRWKKMGYAFLLEQADRQVYPDGAYIQQSHTYHRVAMQAFVWAAALLKRNGEAVPHEWLGTMERSLDFLLAHQNPEDGRLPNYGSNDGSWPVLLSSTDYTDFRSTLQNLSLITRGERIYEPGPWDEPAAWYLGPDILKAPLRRPLHRSVSMAHTGYHVLRGNDPGSFGAFRCGTILDRFSQIDMLHLDVWWHGQNVLIDGGSYLYNGPARWHNHFLRTGVHNTIEIDGAQQMPHIRQFKTILPTKASLLRFEDTSEWSVCEGEHYGYMRDRGCVHRRAVLYSKDDLWVVADTIEGDGRHALRLHWLAGDFPYEYDPENSALTLNTPRGPFEITVLDQFGLPWRNADVVRGAVDEPRGWSSRYYGEKLPVPSLVAPATGKLPTTFVSVFCAGKPSVFVKGGEWSVRAGESATALRFRLAGGRFEGVSVAPSEVGSDDTVVELHS